MGENLKTNHTTEKVLTISMETIRASLFSSIEIPIQHEPLRTPTLTETTKSTLPSDETPLPPELIATQMFNNS